MNIDFLQISLLALILVTGSVSLPAQAFCEHEELCEAQNVVNELLEDILYQHRVIGDHLNALDSLNGWGSWPAWYDRTKRFFDVVSRYLRIGTLESQLLLAHGKLSSVQLAMSASAPGCDCDEKIQLSAGFSRL